MTAGREAEAERVDREAELDETGPPSSELVETGEEAWRELRALWQRGWSSDDTPKAIAIARNAFERACEIAEPDEILDGAKRTVAAFEAGDGVRFLPALSNWLIARGWEKPPPIKRGRARANGHKAHRSNGYAKPNLAAVGRGLIEQYEAAEHARRMSS